MAVFDPKEVSVLLDGREISDWADGADVISVAYSVDDGEYVIGADSRGIFIANTDKSGTLTLKVKQHSEDNAYLSKLRNQQKNSIKTFAPMTLSIRDLMNGDVVTATKGYFTTPPSFVRGQGHNPETWTIKFESVVMNLEKGL
ncbi:phage protein [Pasteurella multocida]